MQQQVLGPKQPLGKTRKDVDVGYGFWDDGGRSVAARSWVCVRFGRRGDADVRGAGAAGVWYWEGTTAGDCVDGEGEERGDEGEVKKHVGVQGVGFGFWEEGS